MSGRPRDPEDSGEEQTFNYDFGVEDDDSSSEEEVLQPQPAPPGRRRARGGAPPRRQLPQPPARPAWQYMDHQQMPFDRRHPRGVQEYIIKYESDAPGYLAMNMLARWCQMEQEELERLNFGVDDIGHVNWHLRTHLDATEDYENTMEDQGMAPYFTSPADPLRRVWLPLWLDDGLTRVDDDLHHYLPLHGDFGRVIFDPTSFADNARSNVAARDTEDGAGGINTIRVDFRPGDILLCEHRCDRFIQDLTLSWPTHAGICIDGDNERAVDAMPGRTAGDAGAEAAVQELDIMTGAGAFLSVDGTPAGGLVYRYIGGGETGDGQGDVARKRHGGVSQKKLARKKARSASASRYEEMVDPAAARMAAIGAATWARQQIGKAYKFSLRSHIIGIEIKRKKEIVPQVRDRRYIIPDKRWRADQAINVEGKRESEVEFLASGGVRKTATTHHSMFCSELVWRAYRFGAGVTLVPPAKFFDMYKHTNRTCALLLDELGEQGLEDIAKTRKLKAIIVRNRLIARMRQRHPGLILAPVQLAQSKFVERVALLPKDGVDDTTQIRSFRGRDVHPADVAEAVLKGKDKYEEWLNSNAVKLPLSRENLYDPDAWKKYL